TQRAAHAAEAAAAEAQVQLLEAGPRREELAALAARVRAARANEERIAQALERERSLERRGASTRATVDDLDKQLAAAKASRQGLEQELAALRKGARDPERQGAAAHAEAAERSVALSDARIARHLL